MRMKFLLPVVFMLTLAAVEFSQDSAIKATKNPRPAFPAEASNPVYGDDIKVAVKVDKKGDVTDAGAIGPLAPCSNLNDPVLKTIRKAATDAAKQMTFEPILRDGKPIETGLIVTYPFPKPPPVDSADVPKLVKGGVLNGKALSLPKPSYSTAARRAGASGNVEIRILIAEDGSVISAGPESGHPLLVDDSIHAACTARFSPTQLQGRPVKVAGVITYKFIP